MIVILAIVLIVVYFLPSRDLVPTNNLTLGQGVADAYLGTTTPQVADLGNLCVRPTGTTLRSTGVLGTVNILNANTSAMTIYDATTSNSNLRLGNEASSTLILAEFPANQTEGTYQFNIMTKYGILIDYATAGAAPTSTISFMCTN